MAADYDLILQKYFESVVGNYIVTDTSWKVLYCKGSLLIGEEQWKRWCRLYSSDPTENLDMDWEIAEKDKGLYYRVRTKEIVTEEDRFLVHQITDVSDFASIFQDLSSYSRMWRRLSTCQSDLMNVLSDPLTKCLPIVVKHLQAECAVLYVDRTMGELKRYVFSKDMEKVIKKKMTDLNFIEFAEQHSAGKTCELPGFFGEFTCFTKGCTISGDSYGLYVAVPSDDNSDRMLPMYFSMFKLYIENALLREKVVYESEHDHLTGLYNKVKYSQLMNGRFRTCEHITIFNLDVNYLKRINDTMGHEAGNTLLRMAAKSLKEVADGEDIFAFRLGGDEFMLVAADTDEEKGKKIEKRWRQALADINAEEGNGIECVIACGMVTGSKPYDIDALLEASDKLMYADKRAIKIARGDDPDAR